MTLLETVTEATVMWKCLKCSENVDENFDVCWNCGTSKEGIADPSFSREVDGLPGEVNQPVGSSAIATLEEQESGVLACLRCRRKLEYVGTEVFQVENRWGVISEIARLFEGKQRFDLYCCPRCGHVEFFADGIGQHLRPR